MGFLVGFTGFIVLAIIILIILSSCVKIVPQAQACLLYTSDAADD